MKQTRLLKISTVQEKISKEKAWIYNQIMMGKFPAQIRTGSRAIAWVEREIDDWISARIAERDQASSCP